MKFIDEPESFVDFVENNISKLADAFGMEKSVLVDPIKE